MEEKRRGVTEGKGKNSTDSSQNTAEGLQCAEDIGVRAVEQKPKNNTPLSTESNNHGRRPPRWDDYTLIARKETSVMAPHNRVFTLVAEVRTPQHGTSLQLRVGRAHPDDVRRHKIDPEKYPPPSPRYMSLFFEDVIVAQELQAAVYCEAISAYKELEIKRLRERSQRERNDLERRIKVGVDGWKKPLLEMREAMMVASREIADELGPRD